jgi:hypothetical protein
VWCSLRGSLLIYSVAAAAGCSPESWAPPTPAGSTWRYDHQGFNDRSATVVTGSFRGPAGAAAYVGAFAFRDQTGASWSAGADPFAESKPIDGIRFNQHLAGQGRKLSPSGEAPAASSSPSGPAPRPGEP